MDKPNSSLANLRTTIPTTSTRKRKRHTIIDTEQQLRKRKQPNTGDDEIDLSLGINKALAHMNNHLLADYLAQCTRNFQRDLSSIELDDRYIAAKAIRDTTSWEASRSLDNLPGFLEKYCSNPTKLWSASKKCGAPHTIMVTGAGLRAADLARVLRKFQTKDVTVAKLFAKHIKLQDAIKFLRNTRTGLAVGTPTRLNDLMDDGALSIDKLERIVIDASHIDQKKRGILDMKEVQVPLVSWLNRSELKERFGQENNSVDLIFY